MKAGILQGARLQDVQVKARFGHKDWIYWRQADGSSRAEWKSAESMKRALLATGTKGFWCLVTADDGHLMKGYWRLGITIYRNSLRGW